MGNRDLGLVGDIAGVTTSAWPFTGRVLTVNSVSSDADFTTVQAAINAAVSGDAILIAPGNYVENLTLKDGITLIGLGGRNAVKVKGNFSANGDLVTKATGDTSTTFIYGMTFEATVTAASALTVSAFKIEAGFVRMWDCEIQLFRSQASGGGTYRALHVLNAAVGGSGHFHRCRIIMSDSGGDTTQTSYAIDWLGKLGEFYGGIIRINSTAATKAAIHWNAGTNQCVLRGAVDVDGEIVNDSSGNNILLYSMCRVSDGISGTADPTHKWEVFGRSNFQFADLLTVDKTSPSADYKTVQEAIDAANTNSIILIGPGTYVETLLFSGTPVKDDIRLVGAGKDKTIIQGALSVAGNMIDMNGHPAVFEGIGFDLDWTGASGVARIFTGGTATIDLIDCDITIDGTGATGGTVKGVGATFDGLVQNCSLNATLGGAADVVCVDIGASRTITALGCISSINGGSGTTKTFNVSLSSSTLRVGNCQIASLVNTAVGTVEMLGLNQIDNFNGGGPAIRTRNGDIAFVDRLNFQVLTADPSSLTNGDMWLREDLDQFRIRRAGITRELAKLPWDNILTVDPTNINADHTTIQSALNAAIDGTHIFVAAGDYAEELSIPSGINLTLEGLGSPLIDQSNTDLSQVRIRPAMTAANAAAIKNGGTASQRVTLKSLLIAPTWDGATGPAYGVLWNVTGADQLTLIDCVVAPICIGTSPQGALVALRADGNGKPFVYNSIFRVDDSLNQLPADINTIECDGGSSEIHLFDCQVLENLVPDPPAQIQASNEGEIFLINTVCKGNLKSLDVLDKFYIDTSSQFKGLDATFLGRIVDRSWSPFGWRRVRAATTANVTLVGGTPDATDGISLAVNDRVLVKDQTTGSEIGLYYVSTLGTGSDGTWTRVGDAVNNGQFLSGKLVSVSEGTAHGKTLWQLETADPIIVDTTSLAFGQIGAGGGGGEANTSSNAGGDEGLALAKAGVDLPFKGLTAGANITLTPSATDIVIAASGGGGGVFGTEYHSLEVAAETGTTSTTFVEKLSLVTASLPIGTYIIHWSIEQNSSNKGVSVQLEMDDGGTIGNGTQLALSGTKEKIGDVPYTTQAGHVEVTFLSAATHRFDLDHRENGAGSTSTVRRARIALWRIS